jgi:S1-C subfamily serine protease
MSAIQSVGSFEYVQSNFSPLNAHAEGLVDNEEQLSRLKRFRSDRALIKNIGIGLLVLGVLAILLALAYNRYKAPVIETVEKPVYIDKPVYNTIKVPDPKLSKVIEVPVYIDRIVKVPIQITSRNGGVTDFTFFNTTDYNKGGVVSVVVGASYEDVTSPYPESQWCYATGSSNRTTNTHSRIDLARKDGLNNPKYSKITQTDADNFGSTLTNLESAQNACDFFPDQPPIEETETGPVVPSKPYPTDPPSSGGKSGTGFYVNSSGYVVTNEHVISGCSSVWIEDNGSTIPGIVAKQDSNLDIAVIKVNASNHAYAKFADKVRTGEDVMAVGFPLGDKLGEEIKVTTGNISALSGVEGDSDYIQFTAPIQPGNSGGPLINDGGFVVGINTAAFVGEEYQNINFAIKGNSAQQFLGKNGIKFEYGTSDVTLKSADLADKGKEFTVRVLCSI